MEYLVHFRKNTKETAESIYTKMPFLDSDYLKLVMDVEDCDYFLHLNDIGSAPLKNTDISFLTDMLYDYLQKVKCLRDYAERKFGDNPYGRPYKVESA